jgi:hypothetical protein
VDSIGHGLGPARPEHRLASAWRQSPQACISSQHIGPPRCQKTYFKSDHFNEGGSAGLREQSINPSQED